MNHNNYIDREMRLIIRISQDQTPDGAFRDIKKRMYSKGEKMEVEITADREIHMCREKISYVIPLSNISLSLYSNHL